MALFKGKIVLQGHTKKDVTTLNYTLASAAYAGALIDLDSIRGSLVDITKAFVKEVSLTEVIETDGTFPADSSADTFEEAAVSTYLNDPADAEKLHTVRVPAPIDALFLSDNSTVQTSNALLIQYIQQLNEHATLSDGEVINVTTDNGIKSGYKRSRARRFN